MRSKRKSTSRSEGLPSSMESKTLAREATSTALMVCSRDLPSCHASGKETGSPSADPVPCPPMCWPLCPPTCQRLFHTHIGAASKFTNLCALPWVHRCAAPAVAHVQVHVVPLCMSLPACPPMPMARVIILKSGTGPLAKRGAVFPPSADRRGPTTRSFFKTLKRPLVSAFCELCTHSFEHTFQGHLLHLKGCQPQQNTRLFIAYKTQINTKKFAKTPVEDCQHDSSFPSGTIGMRGGRCDCGVPVRWIFVTYSPKLLTGVWGLRSRIVFITHRHLMAWLLPCGLKG